MLVVALNLSSVCWLSVWLFRSFFDRAADKESEENAELSTVALNLAFSFVIDEAQGTDSEAYAELRPSVRLRTGPNKFAIEYRIASPAAARSIVAVDLRIVKLKDY